MTLKKERLIQIGLSFLGKERGHFEFGHESWMGSPKLNGPDYMALQLKTARHFI